MSDLSSVLIGMICSIILVIFETIIDKINEKYSINKIFGVILRSIIIGALLIPLLLWTKSQIPGTLSIIQKNITVSYHTKEGMKIEGNFSGKKNMYIYLLVRQVIDTEKDVWTVTKEVVSISLTQSTWDARIYLKGISGDVKPGDTYSLIGVMTNEPLKTNAQIETPELKKLDGVITEELEIKIAEVSNV
ncbi:MAG: hypothetical protein QG657_5208 [Acidobacteriota bacterium]|nr:hypothetical protein [Acidobacteriota bacterium]